ncbi:hypothetical protein CYMTET_30948, partial [Cymbomonas tetramitiformis]
MEALQTALASSQAANQGGVAQLLACLEDMRLDIHICSVGGVGTDLLLEFFDTAGFKVNLVTDRDYLKHTHCPPTYGDTKVAPRVCLYLFGDPLDSVCSHYRRGWAYSQAHKTSGGSTLVETSFPPTFEEYLKRGEDLFGYESHIGN